MTISIHAPVKGATSQLNIDWVVSGNFNPRSREGSDNFRSIFCYLIIISIHAPVKGATYKKMLEEQYGRISIHAPVKGATRCLTKHGKFDRFQSTLPWRERRVPNVETICWLAISIHAPVKGATVSSPFSLYLFTISIHAPVKGATILAI